MTCVMAYNDHLYYTSGRDLTTALWPHYKCTMYMS